MKINKNKFLLVAALLVAGSVFAEGIEPFLGRWALTIPGGGAGWLGVTDEGGYYDSTILWGGGSVVDTASTYVDGDTLYVTRERKQARKDDAGKVIKTHTFIETITATIDGNDLKLTRHDPRRSGEGVTVSEFTGTRIMDLPPAPNLSKVKYGKPIELFKKNSLDGWRLVNPKSKSAWIMKKGTLINDYKQDGKRHVRFGNLQTEAEFEDFNLNTEVSVEKDGNSGIYLRGIYEVQVMESYGMKRDSHHMGAVYSRITPSEAVETKPGTWQTLDITLVDRHITVILNGTKIIDNQPLQGCTGGAMWSDEFRPGPLYLQGDHTAVKYRNMVLTPILN
ncbi:MAG: DUF1080 domain-containing protein [Candidatus Hydrogenedentota bacterium]